MRFRTQTALLKRCGLDRRALRVLPCRPPVVGGRQTRPNLDLHITHILLPLSAKQLVTYSANSHWPANPRSIRRSSVCSPRGHCRHSGRRPLHGRRQGGRGKRLLPAFGAAPSSTRSVYLTSHFWHVDSIFSFQSFQFQKLKARRLKIGAQVLGRLVCLRPNASPPPRPRRRSLARPRLFGKHNLAVRRRAKTTRSRSFVFQALLTSPPFAWPAHRPPPPTRVLFSLCVLLPRARPAADAADADRFADSRMKLKRFLLRYYPPGESAVNWRKRAWSRRAVAGSKQKGSCEAEKSASLLFCCCCCTCCSLHAALAAV